MQKDKRKAYLAGIAQSVLGSDKIPGAVFSSEDVTSFLEDPATQLLQVRCDGSEITISSKAWEAPSPTTYEVHFLKLSPQTITELNMQDQVIVSSVRNNVLEALIQSLQNVYLPTAKKENPDLGMQVKELTAAISKALSRSRAEKTRSAADLADFKEIATLEEECSFWQDLVSTAAESKELAKTRGEVQGVAELMGGIGHGFKELAGLEITKVSELLERTADSVDQLWKDFAIYSEDRTKHLLHLISENIQMRIQQEFKSTDLWTGQFSDIRIKLNECLKTCVNWLKQIADYTQRFWVGPNATRKWASGKWNDTGLLQLKKRLSEIFLMRSQHDELLRLLSPEEQKRLNVEATFKPLRGVNVLHCGSKYSQGEWEEAQKQYEQNLNPIEGEIVAKLRKEIFAEKLSPTQLLREFRRWRGLFNLPAIKTAFIAEREALLVSLISEANQLKEEFETRSGQRVDVVPGMENPPESRFSSKHVASIVWTRQLFGKLQSNFKMAQTLLGDLKQSANYVKLAQEMTNAMKTYETEQYCAWAENIKRQMEVPGSALALDMSGKFMDFNVGTGMLEVNYSERLGVMIREVRQLKELEFKVPKEIDKLAESAKMYYKQAVELKQIADFYNNIKSQIVPSQRPMLLRMAIEFEDVVKAGEGGVAWQNTVESDKYIARVRAAAEGLMNENRKLRRIHEAVGDLVAELLTADLVRNKQRWKEIVDKLRMTVGTVCKNREEAEVKSWQLHWDYQLYKVLQYHYVSGLNSLSEFLPTFNVEITYSNKQVTYNPSLEELKSKYYKEIKSFIGIPFNFVGVSGSSGIFKRMIDANASSLQVIYVKAEVISTP